MKYTDCVLTVWHIAGWQRGVLVQLGAPDLLRWRPVLYRRGKILFYEDFFAQRERVRRRRKTFLISTWRRLDNRAVFSTPIHAHNIYTRDQRYKLWPRRCCRSLLRVTSRRRGFKMAAINAVLSGFFIFHSLFFFIYSFYFILFIFIFWQENPLVFYTGPDAFLIIINIIEPPSSSLVRTAFFTRRSALRYSFHVNPNDVRANPTRPSNCLQV